MSSLGTFSALKAPSFIGYYLFWKYELPIYYDCIIFLMAYFDAEELHNREV